LLTNVTTIFENDVQRCEQQNYAMEAIKRGLPLDYC